MGSGVRDVFGLLRFLLRLAGRNGGGLMAEYVITDEEIVAVIRKAYEAGKAGREVYTVRDYLNRPLVRCRDCKHYYEHSEEDLVYCINRPILRGDKYVETEPYGYCAWGERRGGSHADSERTPGMRPRAGVRARRRDPLRRQSASRLVQLRHAAQGGGRAGRVEARRRIQAETVRAGQDVVGARPARDAPSGGRAGQV
nr:MAG TPA: hypothetical protein [Caudoviricetes sp.]